MVPIRVLRGRPKLANKKQLVSIRYSTEVIDYFRASGAGWQARMDAVLKECVDLTPLCQLEQPGGNTHLTSRFRRRERMVSPMPKSWPASDLER